MKKIKLTQGQYAIVDDTDYKRLAQYKWNAYNMRGFFYAKRNCFLENGKQATIYMSREVVSLMRNDPRQVDHINHDGLDNRRSNLRVCTSQENSMNQRSARNSISTFKGVTWYKTSKKWLSRIMVQGERKHLGYFIKEKEAAIAYNTAAKKYFGDFACLNRI